MKLWNRILVVTSLTLLAVVLCVPSLWADPPVREVILESDSGPAPSGFWEGPAIIWIDGIKYSGEIFYTAEGTMNQNGWHGTEVKGQDHIRVRLARTPLAPLLLKRENHRWNRSLCRGARGVSVCWLHGLGPDWNAPPPRL